MTDRFIKLLVDATARIPPAYFQLPVAGKEDPIYRDLYRLRVLGQWFDGIRFYAAASSPRRSRRTWAGLR